MRLYYIFYEEFGTDRASNWQVVSFINALENAGQRVSLVLPYEQQIPSKYSFGSELEFISKKKTKAYGVGDMVRVAWNIYRMFAAKKNATIYFRQVILLPAMLFLSSMKPDIKIVFESHRLVLSKFGQFCERELIKRGMQIVAISGWLKDQYTKRYSIRQDQIIVLHDALDIESFHSILSKEKAREKFGIKSDADVAVYTGSLWGVKGVDHILAAAKRCPLVEFYLVGRQMPDFAKLYEQYKELANLHILEPLDHNKIPDLLKAADVLLIPHPDNKLSQSPMKLFEYMSTGLPIISSRLENILEVLGDHAIYFEPDDVEDFVKQINYCFSHLENVYGLSQKNIERVKKYSWLNRAKELRQFLK